MKTPIADKFFQDAKDAPVERRGQIIAQAFATIVELENERAELVAMLWAVIRLNDTGHPSGNLDAAVAYRQAEREIYATARALIAKHDQKNAPDHPFSGSSGND